MNRILLDLIPLEGESLIMQTRLPLQISGHPNGLDITMESTIISVPKCKMITIKFLEAE